MGKWQDSETAHQSPLVWPWTRTLAVVREA